MKYIYLIILSSFLFTGCENKVKPVEISKTAEGNQMGYDSVLAAKYGADQYGMKSYVMAFLKAGANREVDPVKANELFVKHMENIQRMAENGELILAGPFFDSGDLKGIYIFNVTTIEEAEALTKTDPAIASGHLEMELHQWYGSAALMGVNDVHNLLTKTDILE